VGRVSSVCIGHALPLVELPPTTQFISNKNLELTNQHIVSDDSLGPKLNGVILSEYCQLFWLRREVQQGRLFKEFEWIYVFQYRKFISLIPGRKTSLNVPFSFVTTSTEAKEFFPNLIVSEDEGNQQLQTIIGPILRAGRSAADNYSKYHLIEDFCTFILSVNYVLGSKNSLIKNFIQNPLLIPSPSLGLHKITTFLDHLEILEQVWTHFYDNYYIQRSGYQRRSGGFLLERLHSFLILSDYVLSSQNTKPMTSCAQGYYFTVSNEGEIRPTV
jgi:hypothetical protein